MALVESGRAIGAVTLLLKDRLSDSLTANVTVGRPNEPAGGNAATVNLFLYEVQLDGHLRNVALDEGQPPPIWLILRYLLTAFAADGESDTADAHELLGTAMGALHELNFFSLDGLVSSIVDALSDNPDRLKLSFEDTPPDLISNVVQGSEPEELYRCSVSFQVRPVMIAAATPPSYSLLVGVDYAADAIIGEDGVRIPVLPSMGPTLTAVEPDRFEVDSEITIRGTDLHLRGLTVRLGDAELPIAEQGPDRLRAQVPAALGTGADISAGSLPLRVYQQLPTGRQRPSNLLVARLQPRLDTATEGPMTLTPQGVTGNLDLTGVLMGDEADDVYVVLYQDGSVVQLLDRFEEIPPSTNQQTEKRVLIELDTAVPSGTYRVILRVNGEQARNSPHVDVVP